MAKSFPFEKVFFYQIPLFIQLPIAMTLKFGSFLDGMVGSAPFFIDIINQILTVITVVCKHTVFFYINMLQQEDGKINVIVLFLTKYQIDRMAISIYGYMDFRTGSSAAVPNLVKRPSFFAPALCWWA